MVEDTTMVETPVCFEFNLDKSVQEFNVREKMINLLEKMKVVDNKLRLKSTIDSKLEWDNLNLLPENENFNTHFAMKELTFRRNRKVYVHVLIISEQHINRIKYNSEVKDLIFGENIWLKIDRHKTIIESSPGYITMPHPKLVNRETYAYKITEDILQTVKKQRHIKQGITDKHTHTHTHTHTHKRA